MKNPKPLNFSAGLNALLAALADQFDVRNINGEEQPIFLAVAFPLREGVTGMKPRLPAGRGFTKAQASLAAAGEAAELLSCLARKDTKQAHQIISKDGIDYIKAIDMVTGLEQDLEAQKVFLDYARLFGQPQITDADSTGCACGENLEDAKNRGLLECIERDALAIWWYGRQSRTHIPLAFLDQSQPRLSYWLNRRARKTIAIDITSDIGVPVVVAVSSEPDGTHVAMGSAAHVNIEEAATSAISEMIQMETSMRLSAQAHNPELELWLRKASTRLMPQFKPADSISGTPSKVHKDALTDIKDVGFSPLAVDLTLKRFPVACARVVVPGLSGMGQRVIVQRILAHSKSATSGSIQFEPETFDPY